MPGFARGAPFHALSKVFALTFTLALASCNTSDTLTPQVDVGGGLRPSSPVTQADTERMAAAQPPYRTNAYAGGRDTDEQFPPAPSASRRGPQNSLEAQARAIEAGNSSPVASAPLDPLPGAVATTEQAPTSSGMQAPAAPMQANLPPTRENTTAETIRFLPIIGAPVQAVTPLSRQLGMRARAAGLTIKPSGDNSSEHILKGYLSAFPDGGSITVVYVWDVLDSGGNRLNRIQGQRKVPGGGSDPWASVPAATMETIAGETIDAYMEWRHAQPG
jgi:hypothetical protein